MPRVLLLCLLPLIVLPGCLVTQRTDTPVAPERLVEPVTGAGYWIYKPSYYNENRSWPMVVSLHGTPPWDPAALQIEEWRFLAEQKGLIVIVPELRSPQGILPVVRGWWYADVERDERTILACMDEVGSKYKVDPKHVLLTGFSAGGFPLYYVAMRHPERFSMVIARSCNSDASLLERVPLTDAARQLPMLILWGRDEPRSIINQSWAAFKFLRENGCRKVQQEIVPGGHLRRPELAYARWAKTLPQDYRPE